MTPMPSSTRTNVQRLPSSTGTSWRATGAWTRRRAPGKTADGKGGAPALGKPSTPSCKTSCTKATTASVKVQGRRSAAAPHREPASPGIRRSQPPSCARRGLAATPLPGMSFVHAYGMMCVAVHYVIGCLVFPGPFWSSMVSSLLYTGCLFMYRCVFVHKTTVKGGNTRTRTQHARSSAHMVI